MRVIISKNLFPQLEQRETELAKYIIASYYEIIPNYRTELIFKVKNYVHKSVLSFRRFINSTYNMMCVVYSVEVEYNMEVRVKFLALFVLRMWTE